MQMHPPKQNLLPITMHTLQQQKNHHTKVSLCNCLYILLQFSKCLESLSTTGSTCIHAYTIVNKTEQGIQPSALLLYN